MSVKQSISKGIVYQFVIFFITFLSSIVLARAIGSENRGIYSVLVKCYSLLVLVFTFGFESILQYKIIKQGGVEYYSSTFVVTLISIPLFFIFIFGIDLFDLRVFFFPNSLSSIENLFVLFMVFTGVSNVFSNVFLWNTKKFQIVYITNLIAITLTFIFALGLFYMPSVFSFESFLYFSIVLSVLREILLNIFIIKSLGLKVLKINFNLFKKYEDVKFALISYFSVLVNFLNYSLDIWLVGYFVNMKAVGVYSIAVAVGQMTWLIPTTISNIIMPFLNKSEIENVNLIRLYSKMNSTIMLLVLIFLGFFSPFILVKLYGDEYKDAIYCLLYLLPGIYFGALTKVFSTYLFTINKVKSNFYATLIGLIFTFFLDFTIIPVYGIIGASICSSIVYFVIFLYVFIVYLCNVKNTAWNYFLINKSDVKQMLGLFKMKIKYGGK